jgi:hypothetical protein
MGTVSIGNPVTRALLHSTLADALADNRTKTVSRTNGDEYIILKVEYTEATGADNTWTDIIGDPANYPRQATGVIDYNTSDTVIVATGESVEVLALSGGGTGTLGNIYVRIGPDTGLALNETRNYANTSQWLDLGPKATFLANATGMEGFPLLYGENGESLIPDGNPKYYKASRPAIEGLGRVYSYDKGVSWAPHTSWDSYLEGADNGITTTVNADTLILVSYKTPANIWEPDVNSEVLAGGVSDVWAGNYAYETWGAALISNLTGKVSVNETGRAIDSKVLQGAVIRTDDGKLYSSASHAPKHDAIELDGSGPAAKAFFHLSATNPGDQIKLFALAKEMKHNGTSWGDNNKFSVVDNVSTIPDENGETVLVCTKSTVLPVVCGG